MYDQKEIEQSSASGRMKALSTPVTLYPCVSGDVNELVTLTDDWK